jgi:pimeloyl-ACP methyl ester carboxylesterase
MEPEALYVRCYGAAGPWVVVLHGGPGAPGEVAPVARGLEDSFRILEPWQRPSGGAPLTVARHVEDLHEVIGRHCGVARPALVGHSWGAMLALAYATTHPAEAGPLVLVGCGTFDKAARARLRETLDARMDDRLRRRLDRLAEEFPGPGERIRAQHKASQALYRCDPDGVEEPGDEGPFDPRGHAETWNDMLRLQEEGVYPAAFAAIGSPVLMLHGTYDPHPGGMIRASLQPYIPHLEYREWGRCGHDPWRERGIRDAFFKTLRDWLAAHPR